MWGQVRQMLWLLQHRGQKSRFDLQRMRRLDQQHNQHVLPEESKILILRDNDWGASYNDHFLTWVQDEYPDIARRIILGRVPCFDIDIGQISLLVPWLQDPLKELYPDQYKYVKYVESRCVANGTAVVNPVDKLSLSVKSKALRLIASEGIRTAKTERIDKRFPERVLDKMIFPFFVRDDFVHGCPVQLVRERTELESVSWSEWANPIAVEFIDTRSSDGLFRKYRYFLFGDTGQNRHCIIAKEWYVHASVRLHSTEIHDEERRFLEKENSHHDVFNRIRKKLELDIVAFDYGFDQQGGLVIWEPNPFPVYFDPTASFGSSTEFMTPLYEKLLAYLLKKAGLT